MTVVQDVEDGVATHVDARMKRVKVEFDAYHLRKTVYEMSAREDGLEGSLNWRPVDGPEGDGDVLESLRRTSWAN